MKKKMLFDGSILCNGLNKNSSRSGIYFVALNIFKKLVESDKFEISLYCSLERVNSLKSFLYEFFPKKNFKIVSEEFVSSKKAIYKNLKKIRKFCKVNKEYFWKLIFQILMVCFSIVIFLEDIYNRLLFKIDTNFDVYFSPVYCVPEVYKNISRIKKYTILHDTIPLNFSKLNPHCCREDSWYSMLINSLNSKDYYFANSENTRQDFLKIFPKIDENKIITTLLACDESFKLCTKEQINISKEKYNIPLDKKYVFSLCTLEPRKNLVRAVKTFIEFIKKNSIEDMVFVLGGAYWKTFIEILENEISNLEDYQDKILKIGYVDDEDLAPLYSDASWFVYTSQYEGFGLPPLEAMSCGCPVITANNSSLPEVVGDAGILIDWDSDEQHIQAYEKYYFDENLRSENSKKGLERAKNFSWDKCANQMIEEMLKNEG